MLDHHMPTTFDEMRTNLTAFIEDIHHALNIMKKRERYSVLEHLNVDDSDLTKALRDLSY